MKTFFLWGFVLLTTLSMQSCGLLKNTRKIKNSSKIVETMATNRLLNSESFYNKSNEVLLYKIDSTDKVYDIRITPTGHFFYSPDKGFEGSASEVLIKTREKSTKRHIEDKFTLEHSGKQSRDSISFNSQNASTTTLTEVLKTPSWKWTLGSIAVFALIVIWVYRTKKHAS